MRFLFVLVLLASGLYAAPSRAQFAFVPYVGYNFDSEAFLVGVGAEFSFLPGISPVNLQFRPSVETLFTDDVDVPGIGSTSTSILQVNGDFLVEFSPPTASIALFGGAGLAVVRGSVDVDCEGDKICEALEDDLSFSGTDVGVNLLGGAEFGSGFISPFVQARLTIADGSAFAAMAGAKVGL